MIKRRALRAAVLATLEEQRIDALAYPTLRRKPALIGEAQGGTNCQLSATTGLPAIAMPAGFTHRRPADRARAARRRVGRSEAAEVRVCVGAGDEAAASAVQHAAAREGRGAAPITLEMTITGMPPLVQPRYHRARSCAIPTTGRPARSATRRRPPTRDHRSRVGLTLQRSDGDKPGPIVAHLLAPNQITGIGNADLRGRNREDLVGGKLFVHFYTRQAPLGVERDSADHASARARTSGSAPSA